MSLVQPVQVPEDPEIPLVVPLLRPKFNYLNTSDRLREICKPPFPMGGKLKRNRKSIFKEVGLKEDDVNEIIGSEKEFVELTGLQWGRSDIEDPSRRKSEVEKDDNEAENSPSPTSGSRKPWIPRFRSLKRPKIRMDAANAPPQATSSLRRTSMMTLLIAVVLPAFSYYNGHEKVSLNGADAGVVDMGMIKDRDEPLTALLEERDLSPTQICTRWSQQTALLHGTLYIYGGQAKTSSDQTNNTWNNDFLTLDLTKSWDVDSPSLAGLPQPSGPPAVANGYLWNDYNNLFLYGGEFADNPYATPSEIATWKFTISSGTWTEYANSQTSSGNNSDGGGTAVQRAAEGAGLSVPELGLSWYFGGHLDWATTPGWSTSINRVYLKSLLEFTHPGYTNDGVAALAGGAGAGDGGAYRNITEGGLQVTDAFYERADGVLVYVPGWGEKGVLIGLAGGTNDTFSNDLSTLDVYDIASSVWYNQRTSGTAPGVRVNPCAVVASAPDASSFQIYLYGGQNLQPYKEQIQYSDMYILSIPSFTWIQVAQGGTSPAARAGHTCNLRDGQIVVVGGYVGTSIACDSPGIYVFNATSLEWTSGFTALDRATDLDPGNSVLAGSNGYLVPDVVASVIGGDGSGSATATTPVTSATGGPFATGKPPVFTVTATAAGNTATVTQSGPGATSTVTSIDPGSTGNNNSTSTATSTSSDSRRPQVIAAGVLAGVAGLLAGYLGYCAWIYKRQVRAYRTHLVAAKYSGPRCSMSSSGSGVGAAGPLAILLGAGAAGRRLSRGMGRYWGHKRDASSSTEDSFTWVPSTEVNRPFAGEDAWAGSHYGSRVSGAGSGSAETPMTGFGSGSGLGGSGYGGGGYVGSSRQGELRRPGSTSSTEGLLDGQEPSFFHVVMAPRRALRVVNGLEAEEEGTAG